MSSHEERCKRIVQAIDTLSQTEIEELFRMIHRNSYQYTKNNHGVFINLSWIPEDMVVLMEKYVEFCHRSKVELQKYESICDVLNNRMQEEREREKETGRSSFASDTRANAFTCSQKQTCDTCIEKSGKVSTSLRFYLLKKKYAKVSTQQNNFENDLKQDEYIII